MTSILHDDTTLRLALRNRSKTSDYGLEYIVLRIFFSNTDNAFTAYVSRFNIAKFRFELAGPCAIPIEGNILYLKPSVGCGLLDCR